MANNKWFNNIARLLKRKDGKYFLKFERSKTKDGTYIGDSPFPLIINEGDTLQARLKKEDLQGLVDNGKLTEAQVAKICETVKFEFSKAPDRAEPTVTPVKDDDDGVNF